MLTLQGKNVLITGGSRGLGAALGACVLARGARVVLVARGEAELTRTVGKLRAESPSGEVHGLAFDVAIKDDIHRITGAAAGLIGPIDVLVHNASTLGRVPLELLLDTECEDFARVLETNLLGPFRLTKSIAGAMALRGAGTIVHISSDAAIEAYPRWGAYGVSKAAFDQLARSFAVELAPHGVRVVSIDPGEMDTQMHADAVPDADRASLAAPPAVAARIVQLLERGVESGARVRA